MNVKAYKKIFLLSIILISLGIFLYYYTYPLDTCEDISKKILKGQNSSLRIITLNIHHGKGEASFFMLPFSSRKSVMDRLSRIAALIKEEQPDIIVFQEVDNASIFSGNTDHLQILQNLTGYTYSYYGNHASIAGGLLSGSSGIGILSKYPFTNAESFAFPTSFPTPTKGYISVSVNVQQNNFSIISPHLTWIDFLHGGTKHKQIMRIAQQGVDTDLIILGDFNQEWNTGNALQFLVENMSLKAFEPESNELFTYRRPCERVDWILISSDLTFTQYYHIHNKESDHAAVVADIKIKP